MNRAQDLRAIQAIRAKRPRYAMAFAAALLAALPLASLAQAADAATAGPLVLQQPSLSLSAARQIADAAFSDCGQRGALVAVAVVDRAGLPLVVLRDPAAGMHTVDTAIRKAWTAVSFRGATTALERATAGDSLNAGIRQLPGVAMIGGGLPIEAAGSQVGAVGISGAPSGAMDEACATAGIDKVRDALEFGD